MARPNMKSVRLSDEALAIVESAPGNGFNDKFETLIFEYSNTIPQRLAQLAAIEKRIDQKRKELETLQCLESKVRSMSIALEEIANLIPHVTKSLNSISQEINQVRPATDDIEIQRYEKAFHNMKEGV